MEIEWSSRFPPGMTERKARTTTTTKQQQIPSGNDRKNGKSKAGLRKESQILCQIRFQAGLTWAGGFGQIASRYQGVGSTNEGFDFWFWGAGACFGLGHCEESAGN